MNLLIKGFLASIAPLFCLPLFSQTCSGDFTLRSQAEIDAFFSVTGGCTVIDGNLLIYEESEGDIIDLAGLSHINSIRGKLSVFANASLKDLDDFVSLDSIYGGVEITYNDSLLSISGLNNVKWFGKTIEIMGNEIVDLGFFPQIDSLSILSLTVQSVVSINAFPQLKKVDVVGIRTVKLRDLTGFSSLEEVRELYITGGDSLVSLHGLEKIETLELLSIGYTNNLENLSGLENLASVTRRINFVFNTKLSTIDVLADLEADSLELLNIYQNPSLSLCNYDFICNSLARPEILYQFNHNAQGCNDFWQVAENCQMVCPVKLYFSKQSEVDSFSIRFPDCTYIEDDIIINSTVTHLDSLYKLTGVGGDLVIQYTKIKSMNGLHNLVSIGENVLISSNDSLLSLTGFEGITSLTYLSIERNFKLEDLIGLTNLMQVNSIILGNLKRIDGLNSLEQVSNGMSVYGKFNDLLHFTFPPLLDTIHGSLSLYDLDLLSTFPDASHLKYVGGLEITRTNFENLDGLSGLERIDSFLSLVDNPKLQSLSGLDAVQSIDGSIEISYNDVLDNFSVLRSVDQVKGDLLLIANSTISSLADLQSIQSIDGSFRLSGYPQLTSLTGIDNLQHIGGDLQLSQLSITDMSGLDQLDVIGGSLNVYTMPTLTSYHGLENLDSIYGEAQMYAIPNIGFPGLTNLEYIGGELSPYGGSVAGLDSLKSVGGLYIGHSISLEDLSPLRNIQEIRGNLSIRDVRKVGSLPQWTNLREIGGNVFISENSLLTDLSGLDSLRHIHGALTLSHLGIDSLNGLDNLQTIDGGLHISYAYMHDLDPLESLQQINGRVEIFNNSYLRNIDGLVNVDPETVYSTTTSPDISIYKNELLGDCAIDFVCDALEGDHKTLNIHSNGNGCKHTFQIEAQCFDFACVATNITLQRQSQIDSFNILFPGCGTIKGDLIIRESEPGAIVHLDSLYVIETVGGHVEVVDNTLLENVNGLGNLRRVGGRLRIVANDHLASISGFAQIDPTLFGLLKSAPHDVTIINNPLLNDCAIEMVCTGFTIVGTSFSIFDNGTSCSSNSVVKDLCNFPVECAINGTVATQDFIDLFPVNYAGCKVLNSDLIIEGHLNTVITGLHGFQQLKQINGDLIFINNDQYMELTGLDSLVEVKGRIVISGNAFIWSLNPLSGINPDSLRAESNTPIIEITNNEYLGICAIEPICAALTNANDSVLIENNSINCNSEDEVLAQCIVSTTHPSNEIELHIYPNPTSGELNIEFDQDQKIEIHNISVFNHMGSLVDSKKFSSTLSLAHLSNGLYTLIFTTTDHRVFSARIVIFK